MQGMQNSSNYPSQEQVHVFPDKGLSFGDKGLFFGDKGQVFRLLD